MCTTFIGYTSLSVWAILIKDIGIYIILYLSRWTRISIPLPNAALTETTRFHWKQSGTGAVSMWAIDNG